MFISSFYEKALESPAGKSWKLKLSEVDEWVRSGGAAEEKDSNEERRRFYRMRESE